MWGCLFSLLIISQQQSPRLASVPSIHTTLKEQVENLRHFISPKADVRLGGGHAPDIITVCGLDNVLPSSTNPTRPYATNTLDEHLDVSLIVMLYKYLFT